MCQRPWSMPLFSEWAFCIQNRPNRIFRYGGLRWGGENQSFPPLHATEHLSLDTVYSSWKNATCLAWRHILVPPLQGLRCLLESRWMWSLHSQLCANPCSWSQAFLFILLSPYLDSWKKGEWLPEGSWQFPIYIVFPKAGSGQGQYSPGLWLQIFLSDTLVLCCHAFFLLKFMNHKAERMENLFIEIDILFLHLPFYSEGREVRQDHTLEASM